MTVTALLPLKNASSYLKNIQIQINNVFSIDDEILIVDDSSEVDTYARVANWAKSDPRIRVISNAKPGLANALNLGLAEASHSWVARVDSDDRYRKDRIQMQLSAIQENTVAVFSD